MTFQDPTRLASHFPGDPGDALLLDWIMRWDARALLSDPMRVFDAAMFWPNPNVLVYSDTLLAAAPVHWVLSGIFGWPLGYNLHYLLGGVMSLACGYLLARWFTGDTASAVVAALVFSFAAVRLSHYSHFQFSYAWLVPLCLWLLLRFLTEREWAARSWLWQSGGVGLAWAVTFLNAGYLALALIPMVAVVVGGWLIAERFRPGPRFWSGVLVALLVALAFSAPVAYKFSLEGDYLSRGFLPEYAAHPGDFLAPGVGTYLLGPLEDWADRGHEHRLLFGFAAMALGLVGLGALALRRRMAGTALDVEAAPPLLRREPALKRRALWLLFGGGAVVAVLSLGEWQMIGDRRVTMPYDWVAGIGSGFDGVRAFGRFTVVTLAAVSVLAAIGFRLLASRLSHRWAVGAAVALGAVMLAEYATPIGLSPRLDDPRHTAVNHELAERPDGPVLELPMGDARDVLWAFVEPPRLRFATIDFNPRVNGYSGYYPRGYLTTIDVFNSLAEEGPASPEVVSGLEQFGVRYLVLRTEPVTPDLDHPGVTHYSPVVAAEVVASLPDELVASAERIGAAVLVELRTPSASLSRQPL